MICIGCLLSRELESSRIVRLLTKLSTVVDRPEFNMDVTWSETGDRYMLKLFRDYLFHQVEIFSNCNWQKWIANMWSCCFWIIIIVSLNKFSSVKCVNKNKNKSNTSVILSYNVLIKWLIDYWIIIFCVFLDYGGRSTISRYCPRHHQPESSGCWDTRPGEPTDLTICVLKYIKFRFVWPGVAVKIVPL